MRRKSTSQLNHTVMLSWRTLPVKPEAKWKASQVTKDGWDKAVQSSGNPHAAAHEHVSGSCWPHHYTTARPPCLLPTPGAYSNSFLLSCWCYPTISSSVLPFSCLQSFPASGSFHMNQFFASGGQSIVSFSFIISPAIEYSGVLSFRMDWLDLLAVLGTLKSLLQHHNSKASILWRSAFFTVQLTSIPEHWKNDSLDFYIISPIYI